MGQDGTVTTGMPTGHLWPVVAGGRGETQALVYKFLGGGFKRIEKSVCVCVFSILKQWQKFKTLEGQRKYSCSVRRVAPVCNLSSGHQRTNL